MNLPRNLRYLYLSHLYPNYGRRRRFSRIQPRRASWQANHDMTRLLAAIGWTP